MSDSEEEATRHKRAEGHRVLKTWKTTSNLAQKAVLDTIAHEASRYDLLRDGPFVRQVRLRRSACATCNLSLVTCRSSLGPSLDLKLKWLKCAVTIDYFNIV
jgi:hypothetical protein